MALPTLEKPDAITAVQRLCRMAGITETIAELTPLSGGKNNRVYRVDLVGGPIRRVIAKRYFRHPGDTRDRLGAEWAFLAHAWAIGVRDIPQPLTHDPDTGMSLFGFAEGALMAPEEVTSAHVARATRFVLAVNAGFREDHPADRRAGSEACFSIDDHLRRVDTRLDRLSAIDPRAPLGGQARRFVDEHLAPAWRSLQARTLARAARAGLAPDRTIGKDEIILSPSDFGFHNVLHHPADNVGPDQLTFIDFEYAGLDDPAKLIGDFFACPRIPTPPELFEMVADMLYRDLGLPEAARARMALLRDVYRIKWACIVLNEFLPYEEARRAFSDTEHDATRTAKRATQLDKAERLLGDLV